MVPMAHARALVILKDLCNTRYSNGETVLYLRGRLSRSFVKLKRLGFDYLRS